MYVYVSMYILYIRKQLNTNLVFAVIYVMYHRILLLSSPLSSEPIIFALCIVFVKVAVQQKRNRFQCKCGFHNLQLFAFNKVRVGLCEFELFF